MKWNETSWTAKPSKYKMWNELAVSETLRFFICVQPNNFWEPTGVDLKNIDFCEKKSINLIGIGNGATCPHSI